MVSRKVLNPKDIKTDRIPPINNLDKSYKINISDRENVSINSEITNLLVFTDGSRDKKGNTGYGITFSEDAMEEVSKALYRYNDIYQAEAIALQSGAEEIEKLNLTNLKIEFYSDSQAVIKALNK